MSADPLTSFVSETFGRQFAELILAGCRAEPSSKRMKFYVTESDVGVETRWAIELISRRSPCRDEPLVLAALLKLLLSQPNISHQLEFQVDELLAELRWRDNVSTRRQVERAITGYVRLLYAKQIDEQTERGMPASAGGGYYHLLMGYIREAKSGSTSSSFIRSLGGVDFDAGFIGGLRRGRVYFAGIDFGSLRTPE
jgi:hypothetical protein